MLMIKTTKMIPRFDRYTVRAGVQYAERESRDRRQRACPEPPDMVNMRLVAKGVQQRNTRRAGGDFADGNIVMASKFLIIAFAACAVLAPPAIAQTAADDAAIGAAKDALKSKWGELQREVGDLRGKIGAYSQQIGELSDPKTSRAKVAELQADIGQALAATLDQGEIASLGQKVLDTDKAWLADIYKHGWTPDRIAMLEGKFKSTIEKTQHTLDDLAQIRKELAATLRRIQSDGDYLEALARVQQSEEMARVLQSLLHDLQTASENLKSIFDDAPGV